MKNINKKRTRKNSNYQKTSALKKENIATDFRTKQEAEAIERLKFLEMHPNVIYDFKVHKIINKSESIGILYWLDEDEQAFVDAFEAEHNAVVYHIIKTNTIFGVMLSVFYVSQYECEWELDRADLAVGTQLVYVKNLSDDFCSEFGSIGFRKNIGGLIRTA